ncbi:MAG TPA: hypothetical protein VJT09_07650 [Pyrinomonadaceae bacterium]|nr:hypothetical protein [Pyrinomonadaceae bacterium]
MTKKSKAAKSQKSASKKQGAEKKPSLTFSMVANSQGTVSQRVDALTEKPLAAVKSDKNLQSVLKVLRNEKEPLKVRLAALQTLQAASFSVDVFEQSRGDYIATLREIVDDPDPELRQRVLGILAREKDGYAQQKLIEGLQHPEKQLVPPEKALQLLSYDVHANSYAVAREVVSKPPNEVARREALRLLAADASSAPLFEKILRDKDELAENRQIAASALHALKPEKLQENAREILLDKTEYKEIKATSLTALAQFGDEDEIRKDKALLKSVDRMSEEGTTKVKQTARRFLSKYER